jgi:hypothetical protein
MKDSRFTQNPWLNIVSAIALWGLATANSSAQLAPCIETNGVKFFAGPQINNGLDVKDSRNNIVLADDFKCTNSGPITDIHVWGSWLNNQHGAITNFWIGIYSDVPASNNGTVFFPSHPGNLLWYQDFGTNYSESPGATGTESFYNPTNNQNMGPDNQAWYYCFFPTNPFVQQGTISNPTNYWLAIRAQIADPITLYGWKNTTNLYNDAAVWGTVVGAFPNGIWHSMTNPITQQRLNLSMMLTTPTNPPPTCCPETNGVKWVQWPDLITGIDYDANQPFILADDFRCTNSGAITDIHLWGSWLFNNVDYGATFRLTIWSDVPQFVDATYSHPGNLLWSQDFLPGEYFICPYTNVFEQFNAPDGTPVGSSSDLYYLCFFPNPPLFSQTGSLNNPTNYWLSVTVIPSPTGGGYPFGWKSSTNSYNDTAVWTTAAFPPPVTAWTPSGPTPGNPNGRVDYAFKITTDTNNPPPPPPVQCVETNGEKYVQPPNADFGVDVWNNPYVLGDDFVCTNPGPITDIHIWGSWLDDQAGTNTLTFWLGIYEDVPVSATNPAFSYPGNLIWQQWFAPGQYAENLWGYGQETFLDPGPPLIIGTDSQIWYYCFYPTNPLVQLGTTAQPKTYWLVAYARSPAGSTFQYGWKSTYYVQNDTSVHAPWPGTPPTSNPGWMPTFLPPTGPPLDLAFKITTPTNRCPDPVPYICQPDKTVECGSAWTFDPPIVGPDPCCPAGAAVTPLPPTTNVLGPCQQIITETWVITDCIGFVGICTQNVTVQDTIPPAVTCSSNIVTFTCDTNIAVSWSITATDICSSVTVTSSPPSGTVFSVNTTNLVTTTAVDACGNSSSCNFTVAVLPPVFGPIYIQYFDTNRVVLTWTNGYLQSATNVLGPYLNVPGATSPYTNSTVIPPTNVFYRLRCN